MKTGLFAVSVVLACIAIPSFANADEGTVPPGMAPAGADVVVLKDGATYQGTLTEVVKNDHVILRLATGQSARIRWDAIARMERKELPPAQEQVPPPIAVSAGVEKVFVHIDASRTVDLERYEGGGAQPGNWVRVCSSPCDREVAAGPEYRIAGEGIRGSHVFALEGARVTLTADVATKAKFKTGIVLEIVGVSSLLAGGTLIAAGQPTGELGVRRYREDDSTTMRDVGLVTMGVGLLAAVPGLVLVLENTSTRVDQSASSPKDAFRRDPSWARAPTPSPPALSFSLFRASF